MNVTLSLRNGRTFRFGYVERVLSDGRRVRIYVDTGDTADVYGRTVAYDEVTGFQLRDVAEIALDDDPSTQRMAIMT